MRMVLIYQARRRVLNRKYTVGAALVVLALLASACTSKDNDNDKPKVVVTYSILGAITQDLVGDTAEVDVIIPNGTDPHEFAPSAKDVEQMQNADVVVANGLDFEAGLEDAIDQTRKDGVPTFFAADHITPIKLVEGGRVRGEKEEEIQSNQDPHFWMDPIRMAEVANALAEFLNKEVDLDLTDAATKLNKQLSDVNAEATQILSAVPADKRKLVTGHDSLGYFAARYNFEVLGAIIPSFSSQAEATAADIADIEATLEDAGVETIFVQLGTPSQVADEISNDTGAKVIKLPDHQLPKDGSYGTFIINNATLVANGLTS